MPLYERARIEVYLPDLPKPAYRDLLETLDREFTYAFGGSTTVRGMDGSYLSRDGEILQDRVTLIYTDAPFEFQEQMQVLSDYGDWLRQAAFECLEEEAILVVVSKVYHSA